MAKVQINEIEFRDFNVALSEARTASNLLDERQDQKEWKNWVKTEKVKEASFRAISRNYYDDLQPVIIKDGPWKGYYYYSTEYKFCLKWDTK